MSRTTTTSLYDYNFKCICIGDSGVGKTALLLRLTEGYFRQAYVTTIGVDCRCTTLNVSTKQGLKRIRLQLWDTAGQERFRTITNTYYRGANGILLVYDISDRETFDACRMWLKDIQKANPTAFVMLCGNKLDVEREVSYEEAINFSKETGMTYSETSAKSNTNVTETFRRLAVSLLSRQGFDEGCDPTVESVVLGASDAETSKEGGGCC